MPSIFYYNIMNKCILKAIGNTIIDMLWWIWIVVIFFLTAYLIWGFIDIQPIDSKGTIQDLVFESIVFWVCMLIETQY